MERAIDTIETRLEGLPISEGLAFAGVQVIEANREAPVPYYAVPQRSAPAECARLREAQHRALAHLDELIAEVTARLGPAMANIFHAQKAMMLDPVFIEQIESRIAQEGINAEMAVLRTSHVYETQLGAVDSEFMRERVTDIVEIRRRLIECLMPAGACPMPAPGERGHDGAARIIVAVELTPSETVGLDTTQVAGFVTERGGAGSHAAILARALGIPAVSGIADVTRRVPQGARALLNGATGEVVVHPGEHTLALYPAVRRRSENRMQPVAPVAGLRVLANISRTGDLAAAIAMDAEGIGLYRTEYECLAANRVLGEHEQYALYRSAVEAMGGRPVYIRLMDLGSDKEAPFLGLPGEDNPCLGLRGARLLLRRPELVTAQARALARASQHGPIHVLYPMIAELEQFLVLREIVAQNAAAIAGAQLRHGVMFEVPAACIDARALFEAAEFGSIGSNDLLQYLYAVDRNNELVAHDYHPDRPVFWRVLEGIAAAAREAGRPLCLCGEIGGQPQYLPRLLALGIDTVSVSPRIIGLARMTALRARVR